MSIPTILVIEDNIADLFLIRRALDSLGDPYQLEVLHDGQAALEFVGQHRNGTREHHPCVILLDLHLPKYNGIEVLAAIKQEPVLNHIHLAVLTTVASPSERLAVETAGAVCWFKPITIDGFEQLAQRIMELCKQTLKRGRTLVSG